MARPRPDLRVLYFSGYTDRTIIHHSIPESGTPSFAETVYDGGALVRKIRQVLDGVRHCAAV